VSLSSADIIRTGGEGGSTVLQMRTSALLVQKTSNI